MKGYSSVSLHELPDSESIVTFFSTDHTLVGDLVAKSREVFPYVGTPDKWASGNPYRFEIKFPKKKNHSHLSAAVVAYFWIIQYLCAEDWEPFSSEHPSLHFRKDLPKQLQNEGIDI